MTNVRPIINNSLVNSGQPIITKHLTPNNMSCRHNTPITHSYAALAFYTSGHSRVDQHGEWNIGPGDVLLVPAGNPHRTLDMQRPEFWGLSLCVPCLAAHGNTTLLDPFERVRDGASPIVHIPTARHNFLEGLFRELEDTGKASKPGNNALDAVQKSLLTLILHEVNRAATSDTFRTSAKGSSVVVDSLRFIERNCLRRLTLKDVAAAVGRSPAYVTTALTKATGHSAVKWIVSGRMAEARRLLLHSDEMIDVISERVGYADVTHFIRMFRREHGTTPAAWRTLQIQNFSSK